MTYFKKHTLTKTHIAQALMTICAVNYCYAAHAASDDESRADSDATTAVVVIAGTPISSVGTPLEQQANNTQNANAQQLKQQKSLNLGEFLDNNLGSVNASNSVGNPYQMDISYRGFTASPILGTAIGLSVFVDGVRVNEPFGDIVNWDLIPTNAIAGISLMPGSNPLFGLNTLGGALTVTTKNGKDFQGLNLSSYAGSWGRRAFEGEYVVVNVDNNTDSFIALTVFDENGYRDYSHSLVRQIFAKHRWHNSTTQLNLSAAVADNTMNGTSTLPASMLANPRNAYTAPDIITNQNVLLSLNASHTTLGGNVFDSNVYFRASNATNANSNAACDTSVISPENCVANQATGDLNVSNVLSKTQQRSLGASSQITLLDNVWGHKNNVVLGAAIDASRITYNSATYGANLVGNVVLTIDPSGDNAINSNNAYNQGGVGLSSSSNTISVYASDSFAITPQWAMTLSARYNVVTLHMSGASVDGNGAQIGSLSGDHRFSHVNPALGMTYSVTPDVSIFGGFNQGMRAPTPVELSCANPLQQCALPTGFASDPNLASVISDTFEVGARGKWGQHIEWDAALYNSTNHNDIQFIANGANNGVTGYFKNVGTTARRGAELGIKGNWDKFDISAHAAWVNATYQSSFTESAQQNSSANANTGLILVNKGNVIPGIAPKTLKIRTTYQATDNFNLGSSVVANAGQYPHGNENNQDSNGRLKGYSVVNLDSHLTLSSNWELFAKATNVFNKTYSTFGILSQNMYTAQNELALVPAAPRGVWVGLSYRFGGKANMRRDID